MTQLLRTEVDPNGQFRRTMTELERKLLPYATASAINSVAFKVHERWRSLSREVFDNPVPMTQKAALYNRARPNRLFADIYIRDEAPKGTPPAKYLQAQVDGGQRRQKGIERHLQSAGILPSGMYVVPGMAAKLDANGNIPRSQVNQIKSQLGAQSDALANQTDTSRTRRQRRERRQGGPTTDLIAFPRTVGKRPAGVYQRFNFNFGGRVASAIRPVLLFVKQTIYARRYPIQSEAQKLYNEVFHRDFQREMDAALQRAVARAGQ